MIPDYMLPFANHLWQSTLFIVAVWLITLSLRKNRAAVRHRLWLAASVKFLIPFSLLTGIGSHFQWQVTAAPPQVSLIVEAISHPFAPSLVPMKATPALQPGWISGVLVGIWICGFVASLLWWSIRWGQVRRTMRRSIPLDLDVPIRVMTSPERLEPGVFGIFRPVLLLPDGITERLSPAQLQAVLAHELSHVRRRDNMAAAIHLFVEALFWFHPLVWFIKVRLIEEQERACDEEVLRLGGDPQVYAESILKICEFYLTSPLICVAGITGSNLKKRIEDIMRNRVAQKLNLSRALLLTVAALAALAGPIVFGIVNVKAGGAQSAPAVRAVASRSPLSPPTAQAGRGGPRGGAGTPSDIQEYRVGEIQVIGAKIVQNDVVLSLLGLVSGEVYNESRLKEGFRDLMKLYGSLGYINFIPEPVLNFDERQKVVNLTINIKEDRQFRVNRISFTGNTTTRDEVMRREILLKEGEVFNASAWKLSVLRLNQLGVFEEIKEEDTKVDFSSSSEPKVDVTLRVTEKGR